MLIGKYIIRRGKILRGNIKMNAINSFFEINSRNDMKSRDELLYILYRI